MRQPHSSLTSVLPQRLSYLVLNSILYKDTCIPCRKRIHKMTRHLSACYHQKVSKTCGVKPPGYITCPEQEKIIGRYYDRFNTETPEPRHLAPNIALLPFCLANYLNLSVTQPVLSGEIIPIFRIILICFKSHAPYMVGNL